VGERRLIKNRLVRDRTSGIWDRRPFGGKGTGGKSFLESFQYTEDNTKGGGKGD